MKIAIISDVLGERSGVGTYYADLTTHLRDHVQQIEMYNPACAESRLSLRMPGDKTQVLTFPEFRSLTAKLDALGPDAIVIPTPGPWGFAGARYARRRGLPLIIGFHTQFRSLADLYWGGLRGLTAGWLLRLVHRWLFRRGEVVIVNAIGMVEEARNLGARAVKVMGTPVAKMFMEGSKRPMNPKLTRVLFAGRLAPEKNIDAVIEAAETLPWLQFVIVGDGPMMELVREASSVLSNLEIHRWVPRSELLKIIDTVDLLVLPSHVESLGSIALEALARNRNVLISANCGIVDWPVLEDAVFRIETGERLAHAIERVTSEDTNLRHGKAQFGSQGVQKLNQHAITGWLETFDSCRVEGHV